MFIKEHQWGEWKVGSQGRLVRHCQDWHCNERQLGRLRLDPKSGRVVAVSGR